MTIKTLLIFTSVTIGIYPIHGKNALLNFDNSDLNALAIQYENDRGSEGLSLENYESPKGTIRYPHDYAGTYDFYFSPLRNKPIKFLEIGFCHGASAKMWQHYFPRAELHFMEIRPDLLEKYAKNFSSRCHFHLADQSKPSDLQKVIATAGKKFDIIIDDGGHTMKQQITSFKVLFPFVISGGVYVIEDLHTSYWQSYGGHGTPENPKAKEGSAICFFQELIHDLNYIGARTGCAATRYCPDVILDELSYYQKHIKSIHFYDSLCFIFKK